jgi:CheY-like chemotaxis protein
LAALGLRRLAKDDSFHQDLVTIQNQTQRAAELVRQLLAFSWRKTLKIRPLNFNHLVQGLAPILQHVLGEKIDLQISLAQGLPLIQGDTNAVEQILTNLALNARDAMPSGGQLTIQTEATSLDRSTARLRLDAKPGHYVRITITDTGQGMDEEARKRIFEPFFTTKEANQSTAGMGLTVVYGLVKEQEGFIEVNSQLQQGTAFQIYFPARPEQTSEAPVRKHENGRSAANGKTILLIEDDLTVRHLVQRVLNRAGYSVVTAEDGQTALEIVQNGKGNIDLIITDVVMPKMGGNKLFNAIQALGLDHEPQFIFMSGYRQDGIQNEGLLSDVPEANFLGKPFSPTDLTEKIHHVLNGERV